MSPRACWSTTSFAELKADVPDLDIDPRVSWSFRGSTEDQQEDMAFLARAMMMALAIMAIILVTQFNSIYQAGLILTAVLFSTGGVLLGHLLMGKPFGVIMSQRRGHYPGRHCREQQYRLHRYLQRIAKPW